MTRHPVRLIALCLVAGCSVAVGPEETHRLRVPASHSPQVIGIKTLGAEPLTLTPGGSDVLAGTITTNVAELAPTIRHTPLVTLISQRLASGRRLPKEAVNRWDLQLGTVTPVRLEVEAGHMSGDWQLGGIPLTGLKLELGVQGPAIDFARANPEVLKEMEIKAGAGELQLTGLGRAHAPYIRIEGGVGAIRLGLGGALRQSSRMDLLGGLGALRLAVPPGVGAQLTVKTGIGSVAVPAGYRQEGGVYTSPGFAAATPHWDIHLEVGVGRVEVVEAER